jgi:hypothetical protein
MNRELRAFILFFLTPGKIKIYLIILIILAIYAIYYRYSMKSDTTSNMVESFHNKNLKANPYKQNESDKDEDSLIEPDMRASQYSGETINNNTDNMNERTTTITKLKKKIIDNFADVNPVDEPVDEPVNERKSRQTDNTRYKEEIAKTYKELAVAEDSKLQAYNRAFNDYLDAQRTNKLNVNIADIGNSIEDGIIDIFQTIGEKTAKPTSSETRINTTIVKPSMSQDAEDVEDVIESFVVDSEGDDNKLKKNKNKNTYSTYSTNSTNSKNKANLEGTSENILLYVLEVVSDFITNFDTSRITYYMQNYKDIVNILTREENLIPAGVLMVIISMALYFIDITS